MTDLTSRIRHDTIDAETIKRLESEGNEAPRSVVLTEEDRVALKTARLEVTAELGTHPDPPDPPDVGRYS
jgi:hypothetical protein